MECIYVFTVTERNLCCFKVNLLINNLETGKEELLTGLDEDEINKRWFDSLMLGGGEFKVGDKGFVIMKSSLSGELDFKFFPQAGTSFTRCEVLITSKDNHVFHDKSGNMFMLPAKFNTITEAVLSNVPIRLVNNMGSKTLEDICIKVDNNVINVKSFNGKQITEKEYFANTMRDRANRLSGLY